MRHVQWSNDALDDLKKQASNIAKDNPHAARRVAEQNRATGDALGDFATSHPVRVSRTYEKFVRRLPDIIVNALGQDDTVLKIVRIIHTSRNWHPEEWPE